MSSERENMDELNINNGTGNSEKDVSGTEVEKKNGITSSEDEEYRVGEDGFLKKVGPPPMKNVPEKQKKKEKKTIKTKLKDCKTVIWFNSLPKKKKIIYSAICIVLCLLIIFGTFTGIFISNKFKKLGDNFEKEQFEDEIYDDESFDDISGNVGADGFNDALREWATTGNKNIMKSKNVINVLLIGADSRQGTNTGNTDVMMVVSLNKKTKEIKLVSFFRDSYLYMEHNGNSCFNKLNAAFSFGGAECLMHTIERNYKIDIDNFVMVNFESFSKIIDAMGGINIDVEKYEADYINSFSKFKKCDMPYGENVKLNGLQALYFCRIRGCYANADVSRTYNQRKVIEKMMDKVKSASLISLNKYIDTILPYVYTGFSESEILSLGMKAITGGWAKYKRTQLQMPSEDARSSGYAGSAWIWVVDYQLAAQELQKELYGTSNVVLTDGRRTLIDVYEGREGTGSSSGNATTGGENVEYSPSEKKNTDKKTDSKPSAPTTTEKFKKIPKTTAAVTTEAPPVTVVPETENLTTTEVVAEKEEPTVTEPVTEPVSEPEVTHSEVSEE